ncbi:MAG TPA: hypothetical protein VKF14_03910 [Candidatus Dormibacteraeota bacterium]|nr:hypothetical protein [Candidatus Dormibacteraeota bacterium]
MTQVRGLLSRARRRLLGERAVVWAAGGGAVAAVLALAAEASYRRWPLDPGWPPLIASLVAGLILAAAGWAKSWPSWGEVAQAVDLRLGARERLTTALEFATEGGGLYGRQREDAAAFAATADLAGMGPLKVPARMLAVAAAAGAVALALALLPNPALQALREHRADAAAQARAADQIDAIARQVAGQGKPGEDPAKRQALARELQQAAAATRKAPDPQSAVARLSQAQQSLGQLKDPNQGAKQDAASAAGKQLAQNADAAKAGRALASQNLNGASSELNKLAQNLPNLSQQQQQQLAQALSQAADAASGDPKLQTSLRQAAQALERGDTAAAQQALQSAAQEAQAVNGEDQFQGDVNSAINSLQDAKQPLENQAAAGQGQGRQSQGQGQGQQPQGQGQGQGQRPGQGQAQGLGQGQGLGQSQGQGQGQGQGQPGQGSGGTGGGGAGSKPAGGTEKVYIPSQAQDTGSGQNQGSQAGAQNELVPYEQVLAQYQSSALSQVDRADIPEQQRQLVQQYFSDLTK